MKPKLSTVWLGGCSGCHMSFLDMDERLIELAQRVGVCASPLTDLKTFEPVDITLVEGAVASDEHIEQLKRVRQNTRVLIAFGDCAVTGNITALRNLFSLEDVLNRAYRETATVIKGMPTGSPFLPTLLEKVRPVHDVVQVDYFLQGCPPSADAIYDLLCACLDGEQPERCRRFG